MSATIYFQLVKGARLDIGAPSSFMSAMERAFGPRPWNLQEGDYWKLQGLAAGLDCEDQRHAVEILAEAVQNGEVRVWAEY